MDNMVKYTIENFEIDFENAYTIEQKQDVLELALDHIDINDPHNKEILLKYKEEFKDLKDVYDIDIHQSCIKDIENGVVELYTCIKPYKYFVLNENYYISIYDLSANLKEKWVEMGSPDEIMKIIEKMKPLIYIYKDSGIGTHMKKYLFTNKEPLSDYFEKFQK